MACHSDGNSHNNIIPSSLISHQTSLLPHTSYRIVCLKIKGSFNQWINQKGLGSSDFYSTQINHEAHIKNQTVRRERQGIELRAAARGSFWERRQAVLARQTVALCGRCPGTRLGAPRQARRGERCDKGAHAWHTSLSREEEKERGYEYSRCQNLKLWGTCHTRELERQRSASLFHLPLSSAHFTSNL